jgi:hypothetical protein
MGRVGLLVTAIAILLLLVALNMDTSLPSGRALFVASRPLSRIGEGASVGKVAVMRANWRFRGSLPILGNAGTPPAWGR